jgi:putative membrane protein
MLLLVIMVFATTCFGCAPAETNTNTTTNANLIAVASPTATPVRAEPPRQDDSAFAMNGAQANMAEIALGRLASQKSKNPDVKRFVLRLIADHTNANTALRPIASKKNITLPTEVKPEQKETYDRLAKLSGAEFDKEFMALMVTNHQKSEAAYQAESTNGTDPELKAFAAKLLPTIQEHLRMSQEIASKLS